VDWVEGGEGGEEGIKGRDGEGGVGGGVVAVDSLERGSGEPRVKGVAG
jgi:hypothetical protein